MEGGEEGEEGGVKRKGEIEEEERGEKGRDEVGGRGERRVRREG